jgi:hypothetical protein
MVENGRKCEAVLSYITAKLYPFMVTQVMIGDIGGTDRTVVRTSVFHFQLWLRVNRPFPL